MSFILAASALAIAAQSQTRTEYYTCKYFPDDCKVAEAETEAKVDAEADPLALRRVRDPLANLTFGNNNELISGRATGASQTPKAGGTSGTLIPERPRGAQCDTSAGAPVSGDDLMITFAKGSAVLNCTAQANLLVWVNVIKDPRMASRRFRIDGHASAVGSVELNRVLSEQRARSVANFLAQHGIERSRIEIKGWGFERPLESIDAADQANQRVEAVELSGGAAVN